jgi:hypothetical protein
MMRPVRQVKGVLFRDYVRMLRTKKGLGASELLPEDHALVQSSIDPAGWYPMASFERMGNAILRHIANNELFPVQMWGRFSAKQLRTANPVLLAPNDPVETLTRFRVLRETFFDFEAIEVLMLHDGEAELAVMYHMGMPAEEAAAIQTMGFFEGLLELANARDIVARFKARSWAGDPRTILVLRWTSPGER